MFQHRSFSSVFGSTLQGWQPDRQVFLSSVQSPRLVIDFMLLDQCFCCSALPGPYWRHLRWSRLCKAAGRIEQGSIRPNGLHMWSCSHCHCPASFSAKCKSKWARLATSCMFPSSCMTVEFALYAYDDMINKVHYMMA